jgi:hypothetical protein
MTRVVWLTVAAIGCAPPGDPVALPSIVPWTASLPEASSLPSARGATWQRAIVHLHSPWSHDACDGDPLPDGSPDPACLADLRAGLCQTRVDVAFVTDHPAYAADQEYLDLFHSQPGDEAELVDGAQVASRIDCGDGHSVRWYPGIEDELMPVALDRHAGADPAENDALYNAYTPEAVAAEAAAGAAVLVAHTEGRAQSDLEWIQDAGGVGVEMFNLHAMFDPDIREVSLGLDGFGWLTDAGPFIDPDQDELEPDLMFLTVLQEQGPSVAAWDALLARGPSVAVAGTDAHQNVLPGAASDGERVDSYRRMMRWFSNHLQVMDEGPRGPEDALRAGRNWVVFEVLGTPVGLDFTLTDAAGVVYEVGSDAPPGTLDVGCPSLHPSSPRGPVDPEVRVLVLRDGQAWQEGCGSYEASAGHVYRVAVDQVPHHLAPFLGSVADTWVVASPWARSNAIRVR